MDADKTKKSRGKGVVNEHGKRSEAIEDSTPTPFKLEQVEAVLEGIVEMPSIGEPFGARNKKQGDSYEQIRTVLVPGIVLLFEKGYNRRMVQHELAEKLNVGTYNKFIKKLVKDGLEAYRKKQMGVR